MENNNHHNYDDIIDFEEASAEWRKNKIRQPYGAFKYRCCYTSKNTGNPCKKQVANDKSSFCKQHKAQNIRPII